MDENNYENAVPESAENVQNDAESVEKSKKFNIFALVGFVLSLLGAALGLLYAFSGKLNIGNANAITYVYIPLLILGVIFGIVGAVRVKKCRTGLAMSVLGIVIGIVGLVASAIPLIILILILTSLGKG